MRPSTSAGIRRNKFGPLLVAVLILSRFIPAAVAAGQEPSISQLINRLADEDEGARLHAANALGELGPKAKLAVPALVKALGHKDERLRWHVARALGSIGPEAKDAVATLAKRLKDDNPLVRAHAAHTLGLIGEASKPVVPALAEALVDSDPRVRRAVIWAFERIRPGPDVSIPLVVKVLGDADPSVVIPALHSLAEAGEPVVPVMIEALKNQKACYWACLVLAEVGPEAKAAAPALASVLQSEEPEVRMQALIALGEIGPAAGSVVPSIIRALEDKQPAVRYSAAFALGRIRAKGTDAALNETAESEDPVLRLLSTWALARIHPQDAGKLRRAIQLIFEAFEHQDPRIRSVAARALVDLDPPPELVATEIVSMLQETHPDVWANAIEAVASLGASVVLRIATDLKDQPFRDKVVQVLARLGPEAKAAVPELIKALKEDDALFRVDVQFALASIGPDAAPAVPALVQSLSDANDDVSYTGCYALGKIGPAAEQALPALRSNLKSDDSFLRLASAWAMLRIQPGDQRVAAMAVPLLIEGLQLEGRELARMECAAALGDLGSMARSAIPALKKALEDESELVRRAAAEALTKIDK